MWQNLKKRPAATYTTSLSTGERGAGTKLDSREDSALFTGGILERGAGGQQHGRELGLVDGLCLICATTLLSATPKRQESRTPLNFAEPAALFGPGGGVPGVASARP